MFILGDEGHYHGRFPWVTVSLVVINVAVYVAQVFLGEPFTNGFSLVPEEIVSFRDLKGTKYHKVKVDVGGHHDHKGRYHPNYEWKSFPIKHYAGPMPIFLTLLTSMFMHANVFHLIGNMWFLLIFGRNVECAMGYGRFTAFYLACGVCAGLAHVLSDMHSVLPCLGASGAISGVMGAYVSIHPFNKIKIWFGWMIGVLELPALAVIGFWFLLQYLSAFIAMEEDVCYDNTAYWAHLGGFTAGFLILRVYVFILQRQVENSDVEEEEEPLTPRAAAALDVLSEGMPLPPPKPSSLQTGAELTGVKAGAPDPFATFLSQQTIESVVQKQKRDH